MNNSKIWFSNWDSPNIRHQINGTVIHHEKSDYQTIDIIDTNSYGRLLVLDGEIQVSEKFSSYTHESLTHPALLCHPNPKKVLIIGGGDGGCIKEILKYKSVNEIHVIEIDKKVVEISEQYFKGIKESFSHKKVKLNIGDGFDFIEKNKNCFDIIILDISDPKGPAAKIFSKEFLIKVKSRLNQNGIVITHCESPDSAGEIYYQIIQTFKEVFQIVSPFRVWIPHYIDFWGRLIASDKIDPKKFTVEEIGYKVKSQKIELEWINPSLFKAIFDNFSNDIIKEMNRKHNIIQINDKIDFKRP